ncbi:MAG TPA: DUF3999 family protein [Verrucomicrobiales bacterium]|nr:DUF3999 family protein [Verrucomicrobiales bacterium]
MKTAPIFAWLFLGLTWSPLPAQEVPDWSAWSHTQSLALPQSGILRFAIPAATVDQARQDLADLRLLDPSGAEMPYALEEMPRQTPPPRTRLIPTVEITDGATVVSFSVNASQGRVITMTLDVPEKAFFKAATVEGSGDGTTWNTWVTRVPVYRSTSGAAQLTLRNDQVPAAWTLWRVRVEELGTPPVPVTAVIVEQTRESPPPKDETFPLEPIREESGDETRISFRLPAASMAVRRLALGTATPLFERPIRLVAREFVNGALVERTLHQARLSRVPGAEGLIGASLEVVRDTRIEPRELTLVIGNGDSPPLENLTLEVSGWRPHLVIQMPQPGTCQLLSGNAAATPPHYDLQSLQHRLQPVTVTVASSPLLPRAQSGAAPDEDLSAAGLPLDLSPWGARKSVTWEPPANPPPVLTIEVPLDAEIMAGSNEGLTDLRIVREGQQYPSLIDQTPRLASLEPVTEILPPGKNPALQTWRISLPFEGLPLCGLRCQTTAPLFDRSVVLYEMRQEPRGTSRRDLGRARWIRQPDHPAARLTLRLDARLSGRECFLEMDNGDNPALPLSDFEIQYPTRRLLFQTTPEKATDWQLYYANPTAAAPRYDLALLAPQLLQARRTTAQTGTGERLNARLWGGAATGSAGPWFWAALAVMVGVLLFAIVKFLPKPTDQSGISQ